MVVGALCVVLITIFIPPLGVFLIHGCGADLLINICLTLLGYLPGHIHAFWLEYRYYKAKERARGARSAMAQPGYGTVGY